MVHELKSPGSNPGVSITVMRFAEKRFGFESHCWCNGSTVKVICSFRLSVRTLGFHPKKTGSIPVGSTIGGTPVAI
jgi:hypothetical protein